MALFKRRETWWIDIAAPTGERIRRSAETRALPEHLRSIAGFSFTAGLRMGSNVIRLTWQQIPRTRRVTTIKVSDIQDQKSLGIPLNDAAAEIIRSQIGNHDEFVFRYRGKPVTSANTDVPKAMIKLVGWKSEKMVERYAYVAPENWAPHAAVIPEFREIETL